ncbi:PLP-dependent cysteine synthase family protein [Leptolyngbya sp. 7M]|uniref:PLP-dependent cysteine synthase family protein n=1 Tax=Leptolyngbya sp. 7M TaxID=2812896 RepID=UPI001B8D8550|nr:PLP-dependent cysteine synthase family protein [Leptolyngbya sp. 7M]QYO67049.1 PLP-dependent cysteine synthase family protein [Leptolyngbya sp. 7M]
MKQTPLIKVSENIFVKLEQFNPTGSHKYRAAKFIVNRAIKDGELAPYGERRIIEKSGGNLGLGLAFEARKKGIGVDLVIGLSFSPLKRCLCEQFGARLIGQELLEQGMQPKQIINQILEQHGEKYFYTDQFNNPENLRAHYDETGPEIVKQLEEMGLTNKEIILVKGAGTGASVTGIGRRLKEKLNKAKVFLVQPDNCDIKQRLFCEHHIEGIMVGIYPPFLEADLIDELISVTEQEAIEGQKMFAQQTGLFPGISSGANFYAASSIAKQFKDSVVLTVSYDYGEGYLLRTLLKEKSSLLNVYIG